MKNRPYIFYGDAINTILCDNFSDCYPFLNQHLYNEGHLEESRLGSTAEILNLKTVISNPYNRCVSGNRRRVNIFFLLAESLWILNGKNDVFFINIFNSKFSSYSDDTVSLHGAYGQRIRKWETNRTPVDYKDQLLELLGLLDKDRNTRRAVISIWNPLIDLNIESKDIPCNDLLMYKIRGDKLYLTVANRSNDLHWGFISDFFSFSFLSDVISSILGIMLGNQTHLSQSMHIYLDNALVKKLLDYDQSKQELLYKKYSSSPFLFKYYTDSITQKIQSVDSITSSIIDFLSEYYSTQNFKLIDFKALIAKLDEHSNSLKEIFLLLFTYVDYKVYLMKLDSINKNIGAIYVEKLLELNNKSKFIHTDYFILALNYFSSKTIDSEKLSNIFDDPYIGYY